MGDQAVPEALPLTPRIFTWAPLLGVSHVMLTTGEAQRIGKAFLEESKLPLPQPLPAISVTVKANWRVTFAFYDGAAHDVNLEDYH